MLVGITDSNKQPWSPRNSRSGWQVAVTIRRTENGVGRLGCQGWLPMGGDDGLLDVGGEFE